jgi:hypothetical protein
LSQAEEFDMDQWEFDVGGLSATPTNQNVDDGDVTIQAFYDGKVVGEVKAIVQVPDKIGKPHDQPSGTVPPTNFGMNRGTSPLDPDTPVDQVRLVTHYEQWLRVAVVDQFGQPLEGLYKNQSVFELGSDNTWHDVNQQLGEDDTYQDPMGVAAELVAGGQPAIEAKDGLKHTAWTTGQEFVANGQTIPANSRVSLETKEYDPISVSVRIAGHALSDCGGDRRVVATAPDIIEIIWPDD